MWMGESREAEERRLGIQNLREFEAKMRGVLYLNLENLTKCGDMTQYYGDETDRNRIDFSKI